MELAQKLIISVGPGQSYEVTGPLNPTRFPNLSSVVSNFIPILFPIAGFILFIFLVWGGFDFLTSMGDPKKAEGAKNKITNALLGFVIIFAALIITQIIDKVFNLGVYSK